MTAISAAALGPVALPPLPVDTSAALGDQPTVPVRPCNFPRLGPTEVRTVFSQWRGGDHVTNLSTGDTVDPANPCHILQVIDSTRVVRSDDNGRSFPTVFTAPPPAGPIQSRMTIGPVVTSAPGDDYVIDTGQAYGIVHSGDGGVHWDQRNRGLPLMEQGPSAPSTLSALVFAPSTALVGYTVVSTPPGSSSPTTVLFQTADGGSSWSLVPSAATGITAVAIDPGDATHVFLTDTPSGAIWESLDAGTTWSSHVLPGGGSRSAAALVVTHPARLGAGRVHLYVKMVSSADRATAWMRSFDDGLTWLDLPTVPLAPADAALAADPLDPDRMVLAAQPADAFNGDPLTLYTSKDGFVTVESARPLWVPWGWSAAHPYINQVRLLRLAADHAHDFFLQVVAAHEIIEHGVALSSSPVGDHLFAFQLSAVAALPAAPPPPPPPPPTLGYLPPNTPPLSPAPTLHQCTTPPMTVSQGLLPFLNQSTSSWGQAGSLTYDGRYLDYTWAADSPPLTGVIDRIDPVTCQPGPPLRPSLPDDPSNGGHPPSLKQLTYDARYVFASGHQGAILVFTQWGSDDRGGRNPFPIYAVDPLDGAAELALYTPPGFHPTTGSCCWIFTYDISGDALWVMLDGSAARLQMPAVHGSVATAVDTCMSRRYPLGPAEYGYATLLAAANGIMYGQMEDDRTVLRADDRSCTLLGGAQHVVFREPGDEDEQIACDPITNGDASPRTAADASPTSLIWVRDAAAGNIFAYAIPDGFCPFPTRLALRPSATVLVGASLPLCATLRRASADGVPITGQTVSFSIDGQPAGSGRTDGGGRACITTVAPPTAGQHRVHAEFSGSHVSFLSSFAEGPLSTFALAPGTRTAPAAAPLLIQSPQLPDPQALQQTQIAEQAQAEGQVQTQASTQSVTQLQPGVMTQPQRQRQAQVATEVVPARMSDPVYQAVAVRPGRRPAGEAPVAVLAAVLLLGVGLLARGPGGGWARHRRG